MWTVGMLLALTTISAAPLHGSELTKAEKKLLGTWEVLEVKENGESVKEFPKFRIRLRGRGGEDWNDGDVVTSDNKKGQVMWYLLPNEGKNALMLGFVSLMARPGVYRLNGDRLDVCFAKRGQQTPPKQFTERTESGRSLWRLKRVK
jgi:uncharacterized protein (TIGR03067 family)